MIPRKIEDVARQLFARYPVVSITGPRQSGKTTLIKYIFSHLPYVSLEDPDESQFGINDPRGFLSRFPEGVMLDEVQRTPQLFSYIQTEVDKRGKNGQFVLSGSQNFLLLEKISQSLAGRVAVLKLLPLSISEMKRTKILPARYEDLIYTGSYPGIFA
ncbi:MAG: AAA family ATPase, partial [Bacteroidales bacterium]